jgi:DNA-binding CsgD family transcriptional regulator
LLPLDVFPILEAKKRKTPERLLMETLTWSDQRKISSFARELYSLGSITAISERIVQRLDTLIGANSVLVNLVDVKTGTPTILADSINPELHKFWSAFVAHRHEHPGIRFHRAHPGGRAVAIADLLPIHQWRKTALFNEVCSKMGGQEQLGAGSPLTRSEYLAVVVNRTRRTFTERDRAVLNILRLHIAEACRVARMRMVPPVGLVMEALEPLVGGGIVVLNGRRTVQFCSEFAREYFETFFAAEKPFIGGLPLTVEKWMRQEIAVFGTVELAVRPPRSLTVWRGERNLQIRLASTRDRTMHILFLRAQDPTSELAKLSSLALGARATEVLYWLGKGKTNQEIGIIVGMAAETVKAHLKKIFWRLQVENRATAASIISELLVRT